MFDCIKVLSDLKLFKEKYHDENLGFLPYLNQSVFITIDEDYFTEIGKYSYDSKSIGCRRLAEYRADYKMLLSTLM